jgi:hypothetical protein
MAGEQNPYAAIAEPAAPPPPAQTQTQTTPAAAASNSNPYAAIAESAPTQPSPSEPSWQDRVQQQAQEGYLRNLGLKPGASQEEITAAEAKMPHWKRFMNQAALHGVNAFFSNTMHPIDALSQGVGQAKDAVIAGANQAGWIPDSATTQASRQRMADTLEQLATEAKENPGGLLGDVAGQYASGEVGGEMIGGAAKLGKMAVKGVAKGAAAIPEATAKLATGTTAADTRTAVRNLAQENEDIQAKAAKANADSQAAHDAAVAVAAEKDPIARQQAIERSVQLHTEAVNSQQAHLDALAAKHATDVNDIQTQNAAEEAATTEANTKAQQQALDQYKQDTLNSADTETQRGELARKAIELKNRLAQHVQEQAQNVRSSLNSRFQAVREKIGDEGTEVRPLSDVADAQQKGLSETGDQKGIFKTIIDKAKSESEADAMRDKVAKEDYDAASYDELPQEHKEAVDETVANGMADQNIDPQLINFNTLRRFSSKLGRAIADGTDDYVNRSLKAVKNKADAMAQHMANSAGVGAEHKELMKDWSNYKDVFKEPTGPSGSGSQVAQSLNAQDISNATAPFTSDDPAVASRAKQLLVGSKVDGTYYNPKGGRLVDALRNVQRQQDALPKPKEPGLPATPQVAKPSVAPLPAAPQPTLGTPIDPATGLPTTTSARVVQPGEEGVPALTKIPPVETTTPELQTITPESLEKNKQNQVYLTIDKLRKLSGYRVASLIAGTASLAASVASIVGDHALIRGGVGLAGAGGIIYALGPPLISKLLESDRVINALKKPTTADYRAIMKLPPEVRPGVEQALIDLNDKAREQGKIKGPNLWKIAVKAGITAARPPATGPQNPQQAAHYVGEQPAQ